MGGKRWVGKGNLQLILAECALPPGLDTMNAKSLATGLPVKRPSSATVGGHARSTTASREQQHLLLNGSRFGNALKRRNAIPAQSTSATDADLSHCELNQIIREGHFEASLVERQASKVDDQQASISSTLPAWDAAQTADVVIVGCGPAGLALASHLGKRGMTVVLVGMDNHFVNNYGVWYDEFKELGLEHTLDRVWNDALCYFGEEKEIRVGRAYGRVCRRRLRSHLLSECQSNGVYFQPGMVDELDIDPNDSSGSIQCKEGTRVKGRLITLASGAASGRFLEYEKDAPLIGAQTAYGIEAEVEGYEKGYPEELMLFMDFRRHHTGCWDDSAYHIKAGEHPNAGDNLWGTNKEVPSFLYAMPLGDGRVFVEETCLVAKPALPFSVLKRRLERRLKSMGIKVKKVVEEEWSYIPVGGPLPVADQPVTAFGAAANLVHPATGYSIARSMREAPGFADSIVKALDEGDTVGARSQVVWDGLWPMEMRRRASFHIFGMELLAQMDLHSINQFFQTFFNLPDPAWRRFLSATLSSWELLGFATLTFILAPPAIKVKLISHIFVDPSGMYMVRYYTGQQNIYGKLPPDMVAAALVASLALQSNAETTI